jgi:uncharacterized protein (TIGR02611 family)
VAGASRQGPGASAPADEDAPTATANGHESGAEPESDLSSADPRSWGHRFQVWRDSIRSRPATYRIYRIVIGIVGGAIVIGGLALVPLPGPGWVIVFVGLAVLATEFVWADRLEKFARRQLRAWTRWLGRQPLLVRLLVGVLALVFVVAVIYGLFAVTGVPGWIPGSWIRDLPGL